MHTYKRTPLALPGLPRLGINDSGIKHVDKVIITARGLRGYFQDVTQKRMTKSINVHKKCTQLSSFVQIHVSLISPLSRTI